MTDFWSFRELYHFVEELFCSLKYCCVVLWTAVMFFEELLLCSLNYCFVLWRTVFQELLFCSFKNCLSRTTDLFFQELCILNYFCCSLNYSCVLWRTFFWVPFKKKSYFETYYVLCIILYRRIVCSIQLYWQ
jgi:hypothetical protein